MRTNTVMTAMYLLCACGPVRTTTGLEQNQDTLQSSTTTQAGELENGLAYDACTWVVQFGDRRYGPSETSVAKIEAFTHHAIGNTKVTIEYQVTGNTVSVPCGWNPLDALDEIHIVSLR